VITPSQVPESFSITTREALTRGIPVVVARLGALPEAVAEGENGFTCDPNRPDELAAILRRLAEDEGLLLRLREGARRSAVLTASEHMWAVRAVYEEAIKDRMRDPARRCGDVQELGFLHSAVLQLDSSGPGRK